MDPLNVKRIEHGFAEGNLLVKVILDEEDFSEQEIADSVLRIVRQMVDDNRATKVAKTKKPTAAGTVVSLR